VGQLVYQNEARPALECGVDIEFVQDAVDVNGRLARKNLEFLEERLRLLASMCLDDADDDVDALFQLGATCCSIS